MTTPARGPALQLARARETMGNLQRRSRDLARIGPLERQLMAWGVLKPAPWLDQPARLFAKQPPPKPGKPAKKPAKKPAVDPAELAARAEDAFGQDAAAGPRRGRLVLVTCTGWVDGVYTRNVVVFARPLGVRAPA